jgi:hypothetical protein
MRRHIALARIGFLRPQPPLADLRPISVLVRRGIHAPAPSGSEAGEHHEAHRLAHV